MKTELIRCPKNWKPIIDERMGKSTAGTLDNSVIHGLTIAYLKLGTRWYQLLYNSRDLRYA